MTNVLRRGLIFIICIFILGIFTAPPVSASSSVSFTLTILPAENPSPVASVPSTGPTVSESDPDVQHPVISSPSEPVVITNGVVTASKIDAPSPLAGMVSDTGKNPPSLSVPDLNSASVSPQTRGP